ncbi:unnamed protein product [Closterium sp. Yama58-4]|nr:unnamed protein product [Closterium sp. Yama58-4]
MAIFSAPRLLACLLILAVGLSHVAGIRFEVTAYSKCLGVEVQEGTLVVASYQVVPSGESSPLTKITAKVTSPFGRQLHWQSDVEEGHFGFTAKESGQFMACFWMPHGTPGKDSLMVDLEWRSGVAAKDWESIAKKEKIDGMGLELRKLDETVRAIRDEMTYFRGRESEIRDSNELTNERVAFISITSLLISSQFLGDPIGTTSFVSAVRRNAGWDSSLTSTSQRSTRILPKTEAAGWTRKGGKSAGGSGGKAAKPKPKSWKERHEKFVKPFILDVYISKRYVSAKVMHRVTSRVVSVATTSAKDLRMSLPSLVDENACRVIGRLIAERSKDPAPLVASYRRLLLAFVSLLALLPADRIGCDAWGHDGHAFTCAIAQALLTDEAAAAVAALLPPIAQGSLPAVCSWADVIRHTKGWAWSTPLHFIDTPDFACSYDERPSHSAHQGVGLVHSTPLHFAGTPDFACSYDERRDCAFAHQPGVCVANAIINYTSQLLTYSPHQQSSQIQSPSRHPLPPSSPQSATPIKAAVFPTSPHWRSLLRGLDVGQAGVLGGVEEQGEGEEEEEREEEMVRVVKRVVRDGVRDASHASLFAAPVGDTAASAGAAATAAGGAASEQRAALGAGSIRGYNLTEALMFLAHFAGDIHQPLHVGFTSDLGGNRVHVTWFKRQTNLHAVWDDFIIASAIHLRYNSSSTAMLHHITHQLSTDWRPLVPIWVSCPGDIASAAAAAVAAGTPGAAAAVEAPLTISPAQAAACPAVYAMESAKDACKWAYRNATPGAVLGDEYFMSRLPIVEMRIAMGGVRLARILNHIFAPVRAVQ